MRGFSPITPGLKTELELAFDRSQAARPVLLWSTVVGICASAVAPIFWAGAWTAPNTHSPAVAVLIAAPLVLCMGIGGVIYRVLVRAPRRDATVGS